MADQQTFSEGNETFYYIFHREIQSDSTDLTPKKFVGQDAKNIESLLQEVLSSGGGRHELEELETTRYFERWINTVLNTSTEVLPGEDLADAARQALEDVAEDFSRNMKTRARAAGKYVVIIVGELRLIICHSYTGKRALTTGMDIVEELLSSDNIDKYAEFYRSQGQIYVDHFEKHQTKSFVTWLGIPEDEVVFEVRGNVNVYSEVAGIKCVFEFDKSDLVEKIIQSDEYNLGRNILRTPEEEPDYGIDQIRWGNDRYDDSDEFMQEAFTIHYQLSHYDAKYEELKENLNLFTDNPIDKEDKVMIRSGDEGEVHARKRNDDFEILFANNHIELQPVWLKNLADGVLGEELIPIYHPGHHFSESPVHVGAFRIYNEVGLSDAQRSFVNELVNTASDQKTGNLKPMLCYILFEHLSEASNRPINSVFEELSVEFEERMRQTISDGSQFLQTEGSEISLEFKASEWIETEKDDRDIVDKIAKKFKQGHRLLVCGLDENTHEVKLLPKSRLPHERVENFEANIESKCENANETHVFLIPVESNRVALAALRI